MVEALLFISAFVVFLLPINDTVQLVYAASALVISIPGLWVLRAAPYVRTSRKAAATMLHLAEIKPGNKVYDLGCGDGTLVWKAAAKGGIATGYELSLPTYLIAKARSLFRPRTKIHFRNFWRQDYRDANVVFCFLLPHSMQQFVEQIWPQLKPGCRVVSNAFSAKGLIPVTEESGVFLYIKA